MKSKILIVDDNPEIIEILYETLKIDYDCFIAYNGDEALNSVIQNKNIDLILLDIMMPDMSGYEVCRILKSLEETKDIPIIYLTAKAEISDMMEGFETGAVDYIRKPFIMVEIMARVKTHIELKKSKEELKELIQLKEENLKRMNLINVELNNAKEISNSKVDYLVSRVKNITAENSEIDQQLKTIAKFLSLIAVNDLGNLKVIDKILTGSESIVNSIIKECAENEEYFRILTATIEPLKTIISNIESLLRLFIKMGFLSKDSIVSIDISKTAFAEALEKILRSGKMSVENYNELMDIARFKFDLNEDDGITLF